MKPSTARRVHQAGAVLALAVAARHAAGARRLRRTLATVDRAVPQSPASALAFGSAQVPVHFVVPVLREQAHVRAAARHFAPLLRALPESTLTFVTTSREEDERGVLSAELAAQDSARVRAADFPQLSEQEREALTAVQATAPGGRLTRHAAAAVLARFPSTKNVVEELLADPTMAGLNVCHVHYVGNGRKAGQVNQAAAALPQADKLSYIALYDVDSRPGLQLLEATLTLARRHLHYDGQLPPVMQQSAAFRCWGSSPHAWERAACRGAARLQTLWTLRREIPVFHHHNRAVGRGHGPWRRAAGGAGLAQTVGHGLWVRRDVFDAVGGMPTYTVLDDLPFGYRLTLARIPVRIVPVTATVPAPEDVRSVLAQSRRWFHNYLDYPKCFGDARERGYGSRSSRVSALAVGCYRGAVWLSRTPATAACLALAAGRSSPWWGRAAAGVALWLAVVTPVRQLAAAEERPQSWTRCAGQASEVLAAYLLSSIGPAAATAERLIRRGENPALAPKTHHRPPLHQELR